MRGLIIALCTVALLADGTMADPTGKWSGSFSVSLPDGTESNETIFMDLAQKGTVVTGRVGPSASQNSSIQNGQVQGNRVTFEVTQSGPKAPKMTFELAITDDKLMGTATADGQGHKMIAKVEARRADLTKPERHRRRGQSATPLAGRSGPL